MQPNADALAEGERFLEEHGCDRDTEAELERLGWYGLFARYRIVFSEE